MNDMNTRILLITIFFTIINLTMNAQLTVLSGVEKGSYYSIANDLKKSIERDIRKSKRDSTKLAKTLATEIDTTKIKMLKAEIASLATTLRELRSITITIETSEGSRENFDKLVKRTNIDIAFLQYDVILYQQMEDLNNNTYYVEDLRALLPIGLEEIHILTGTKSAITSLKDINSRKGDMRVAIGSSKQGTNITATMVKEITKFSWMDYPLAFDNAFNSLINNKIDALFFVGAIPVDRFDRLPVATREKIKLINIDNPELDNKVETDGKVGSYVKTTIPAGTYKWANYDIETYAVKSIIATNISNESDEKNEKILRLLEYICLNIEKLREKGHSAWQSVDFNFEGIDMEIYEDVDEIYKELRQ